MVYGRKKSHGYWFVLKHEHPQADCNGYVLEHRLIYEESHKCCILSGIDCHHINKNPEDNRIDNLELKLHGKHISDHTKERWDNDPNYRAFITNNLILHRGNRRKIIDGTRECIYCGSSDTYKYKGIPQWTMIDKQLFSCAKCYQKFRRKKRGFHPKH